jgi:hypothetical protein
MVKKLAFFLLLTVFLFASLRVFAQEVNEKERNNPFACTGYADDRSKKKSVNEIRDEIDNKIKALKSDDAQSSCIIAELMKRVGYYGAEDYYRRAISADETEPAYELFYADYLRNFRGAEHPLFPQAEQHYFEAWRKLVQYREKLILDCENQPADKRPFDCRTKDLLERGLIALYQEDGLPFLHRTSNVIDSGKSLQRPFSFFSTINNYARLTTDIDRVDDIRAFTSEALFASSQSRLNRALTDDELRKIVRAKDQFDTVNRFRFRYGDWPALDIFYHYRDIDNFQITDFKKPNNFNSVSLNEYGITLEKPFNFSPVLDLFLKSTYKRTDREGIIEFAPEGKEDINHYEINAVISRFLGPDKANLELTYVFQDINQEIPNPQKRDRQIFAATATYQVFRPITFLQRVYAERFATRGIDIFSGVVFDKERYGDVDVKRNDFFVGTSFKGLGKFDVTIQPTIFTSEVEGDKSQDNSQYRTNINLLYRILDEEREQGMPKEKVMGVYLAFLNLVIPVRHDIAIDGPKKFENYKVGIELDTKFFTKALHKTKFFGTTLLASLRYDYQRFYRVNRNLNLFSFNVSMGF